MNLKEAGIYDIYNMFKGDFTKKYVRKSGDVISGKSRIINIPAYQRPYRWNDKYISKMFEDYDENSTIKDS